MRLEPLDRIPERPARALLGRAVAVGVVTGGMGGGPIGEALDQGGAQVGAGPLRRPAGDRVHGQEVVAIDPERGQAIAQSPRGEGGLLVSRDAVEGRDGPLVVDDVEQHRRPVDRGEQQGLVEVALRRRAIADVGVSKPAIALVGRGHGPAHGLAELSAEIARDGEEAVGLGGIHHRQLATLHGVGGVGVDLVHHLHQRIAPGDQRALLAIGGKAHVAGIQRHGLGHRHSLLAGALHVERGLALALLAIHPVVEGADQQHVAQPLDHHRWLQPRRPGADSVALVVQHPDQAAGQIVGVLGVAADVGTRQDAGRRHLHGAEVDRVAGPPFGLRDVQAQRDRVLHRATFPCGAPDESDEGAGRSTAILRQNAKTAA